MVLDGNGGVRGETASKGFQKTFLGLLHGSNWRCSSTQLDDHHSLVLLVLVYFAAAQATTLVVQGRRSRSHIHHNLKTWMSYSTFLGLLHGSNWRCSSTQLDDHHSLVLH
ncbi:unnamed protein product [Boreogadus saida]